MHEAYCTLWVAQAALNLVADLMEHNTTCFREGVDLLLRIHFTQPYSDTVWGLPPATVARYASRRVWSGSNIRMAHTTGQMCVGGGPASAACASRGCNMLLPLFSARHSAEPAQISWPQHASSLGF